MTDLFDDKIYIGIVGSRRRAMVSDQQIVTDAFFKYIGDIATSEFVRRVVIVSGGCPTGADMFAEELAERWGLQKIIHLPDKTKFLTIPEPWRSTKQNYDRNTLIARDARDALIACVATDRTGGTEDTIGKWIRFHRRNPILV